MGSIQRREMVLHIREQLSELVRLLWSPGAGATQRDSVLSSFVALSRKGRGFDFAMQLAEPPPPPPTIQDYTQDKKTRTRL